MSKVILAANAFMRTILRIILGAAMGIATGWTIGFYIAGFTIIAKGGNITGDQYAFDCIINLIHFTMPLGAIIGLFHPQISRLGKRIISNSK